MLFSSFLYIFVFLPLVATVFRLLVRYAGSRTAQGWLLLSSLVFYALGDWRGLPILLASAVLNSAIGRAIGTAVPNRKRRWLRLGLLLNVALLLIVKYWAFLLGAIGVVSRSSWHVPLGVSFFTLVQLIYLVDCYEGLCAPHRTREHLLFSSFFAYVTMGPLIRSRNFSGAVPEASTMTGWEDDVARGLEWLVTGLFKKAVLAQSLAMFADAGWGLSRPLSGTEAWVTIAAFAFELYFDFSGYSDMAIGSALLFGIKLPLNFDSPYTSTSIIQFWKRWHITLSAFITTYLYTPLLRLRRPTFTWAMVVTILSMVIAGLWHGAAWTFVTFGLFHGCALVINHVWRKSKLAFPVSLGWLLTFLFVALTLVLFRAQSLGAAGKMFASLVQRQNWGFDGETFVSGAPAAVRACVAGIAVVVCLWGPTSQDWLKKSDRSYGRACVMVALALASLLFMNSSVAKEFIYRDF